MNVAYWFIRLLSEKNKLCHLENNIYIEITIHSMVQKSTVLIFLALHVEVLESGIIHFTQK